MTTFRTGGLGENELEAPNTKRSARQNSNGVEPSLTLAETLAGRIREQVISAGSFRAAISPNRHSATNCRSRATRCARFSDY